MVSWQPSTVRGRAVRLLIAGLIGGVTAWLLAFLVHLIAWGPQGVSVVAVGGAITILFFGLGQLVQVAFAESSPMAAMMAALMSYVVRVVGLALLAWNLKGSVAPDNGREFAIVIVAVVAGWLTTEVWGFQRLRIPAFDPPQAKTD